MHAPYREAALEQFSTPHLAALAATAAAAAAAALWARRHPPRGRRVLVARRALAAAMVASEAGLRTAVYLIDGVRPAANLPLHLTDWAWLACVVALWTARPLAFELAWFWGAAAVSQALITPSVAGDFPDLRWWHFMSIHAPVIVGIVLLAAGCRMTPRRHAPWRAWAAGACAFAVAAAASAVTGGNYMFARRPPADGSVLDLMGPWPWYLAGGAALGAALFWLLDRPFDARRRAASPGPPRGRPRDVARR